MAASVVQFGRRRGSIKSLSPVQDETRTMPPIDFRQVTVMPKAEWLRIQSSLSQAEREKERIREAVQQREALHLRSKEAVKHWPNTIEGQRLKKLQAKKIREEMEEEQRKKVDVEEAKYQEQRRKEAIAKAKAQQYYQIDRVKRFHGALLMTEVLKEREAQIELKKRLKKTSKDIDNQFIDMDKRSYEDALKEEEQKALQRELKRTAFKEQLAEQVKQKELERDQEILEKKKDIEELQRHQHLYLLELDMEEQKREEQKRNLFRAHSEYLTDRNVRRALDAKKQEMEEEQRKLFADAKQKMMKLRQAKEAEIAREAQMVRDRIREKLSIQQQEQIVNEDLLISKVVAEQNAKLAQQQRMEKEKRAAMVQSIIEHREAMKLAQEQKQATEHQDALKTLEAKKEADRLFLEKQQQKMEKMKRDAKIRQDSYIRQMAEKSAKSKKLKEEVLQFEARYQEITAEDEMEFQQYAKRVINAAEGAQRNVLPLRKAAREGMGGGLGPVFGGVRPSYLVQDVTGVEMPSYFSSTTQDMKELLGTVDIQDSKHRLGLVW